MKTSSSYMADAQAHSSQLSAEDGLLSLIRGHYRYRADLGLVFDYVKGIFHRLEDGVATDIVSRIFEGDTIDGILAFMLEEYDVDPVVLHRDIGDLISNLNPLRNDIAESGWYTVDKGFTEPLGFPLRLEMELTSLCNWNCGFCYNVWKIDPTMTDKEVRQQIKAFPQKHLPKDLAFKILDEAEQNGCMIMRYSGGEPSLHPDFMEILKYGGEKKMYQVLFTNGHFVTEKEAALFRQYNVRTVLISLHGDKSTHNTLAGHAKAYEKAKSAIAYCLAEGIEVVVEATLVQDNLPGMLDIMRDIYRDGVREFRVMRYVPTGKNDEAYAVPQSQMIPLMAEINTLIRFECPGMKVGWPCGQKFCTSSEDAPLAQTDPTMDLRFSQLTGHCESGLVWGSISFDGKIRNCPHSNVYFGHVGQEGILAPWQKMTEKVMEAITPRSSCSGCHVLSTCKGGCHLPKFIQPANANASNGSGCA